MRNGKIINGRRVHWRKSWSIVKTGPGIWETTWVMLYWDIQIDDPTEVAKSITVPQGGITKEELDSFLSQFEKLPPVPQPLGWGLE